MVGTLKKESMLIAKSISSFSVCTLSKNCFVEIKTGGEAIGFGACCWSVDADDELEGIVRALAVLGAGGADDGRF